MLIPLIHFKKWATLKFLHDDIDLAITKVGLFLLNIQAEKKKRYFLLIASLLINKQWCIDYNTYLIAVWVSCFISLKKATLNWCLTNNSCNRKYHTIYFTKRTRNVPIRIQMPLLFNICDQFLDRQIDKQRANLNAPYPLTEGA